jgi:deoxyribonuclease-4
MKSAKNLLANKFKHYPPLGAHTSIAGGIHNAIYTGARIGCGVVQIFSKNQLQWQGKEISQEEVDKFREAIAETGVYPMTVHDSYLINLASPNAETYRKSFQTFTDELKRCEFLGIPYLVMHPGSHMGRGEAAGITAIAEALRNCYTDAECQNTVILLETTAGQGTNLGYTFEQLRDIIDQSRLEDRIAVCVDTCHIFAAGYDLRTMESWNKTKKRFDRILSLEKLKVFHLNDSLQELGSRVDRHARIGKGKISLEGFSALVNDPDLCQIPMILEIPGGNKAYQQDIRKLRRLIKKSTGSSHSTN